MRTMTKRRANILYLINNNKFSTYEELSSLLKVSVNTIRRDVEDLEMSGEIIKIKGGSIILNNYKQYKSDIDFQRKRAIGKFAASLIKEGETIIVDGGTTTKQIIPFLHDKKNLVIFTQSLDIAYEIAALGNPSISLVTLGGILDYKIDIFFSEDSSKTLSQYNFDKGFLSASAINLKNGITNINLPSYGHKNLIMNGSEEFYFLIDSTKFGTKSLQKICDLSVVKSVVTDKDLNENEKIKFEKIIPNFYITEY